MAAPKCTTRCRGQICPQQRGIKAIPPRPLAAGRARRAAPAARNKTHVNRMMAKLSARDRAQLVVIAYETGLVRPGLP